MRQRQKRFRDEKRKIRTPCPQHHQDPVFQCKKEKKRRRTTQVLGEKLPAERGAIEKR